MRCPRLLFLISVALLFWSAPRCNAAIGTRTKDVNEFFDRTILEAETALTDEEFAAARAKREVVEEEEDIDDSAMYHSGRFEGDIANNGLNSHTIRSFVGDAPATLVAGVQRNAVRQSYLKWPEARIPYAISSQYSSLSRSRIADAIEEYAKVTCINFTARTPRDGDYIYIMPDDGCYSLVGRTGGRQVVSLGDGCIQKGIIIHELMHSVGFFHEQSRADRDDYVRINWDNVQNGLQDQFDKYSLSMIDHLGTKYDYGSIMHYAKTAFSRNGLATIEPLEEGARIGQRRGFSQNDIAKINKLYSCPKIDISSSVDATPEHTTRPSTRPPATPSPSSCKDRRFDCDFMSRAGHCESRFSRRFMQRNCPRSCGQCDVRLANRQRDTCSDSRSWCDRWARAGMCLESAFEDYMISNCKKSCGKC